MHESERPEFNRAWLKACAGKKQPSDNALEFYFDVLQDRDLEEIARALILHARNPDTGQYSPQPGDIIRLLDGGTLDAGQRAWSKVLAAIKHVGPYSSPVFDDPVIHRVVQDMGGWIELCSIDDRQVPFTAQEFARRYSGFRSRGLDAHPSRLTGIVDAHNETIGIRGKETVVIGNEIVAAMVASTGHADGAIKIVRVSDLVQRALDGERQSTKALPEPVDA